MYSFSFEPNHAWPYHFSTQDVLYDYFRRMADKYGLREHIRFETTVSEARFDEKTSLWNVRIRDKAGKEETLGANAIISAVGQLNQPKMPDIKGIETFKGPAFHTARWRHDVDLTGKRVAVIGTGATAFQVIPEIAPNVRQLLVFQRSAPWLGPTPNYHDKVADGKKWLLEHVPYYDKWYRFWLFWTLTDGILDAVAVDPFPVPHDAREPVQYVFSDGDARLGVVTDLGTVTQHVVEKLSGCQALVIECNHDLDMLMAGPYPDGLKRRVAGRFGHLSNADAGRLVAALDRSRMRHLIAAHLSQQNNKPALAVEALSGGAGCEREWVGVAEQEMGFGWRDA